MTDLYSPLRSLRAGHWFKLICGASFQYLPAVRNLTLAYTLAGVDCIDVAADPAVVLAAKAALEAVANLAESSRERGFSYRGLPWLMASFNDGEDPHFRKAEFDAEKCPSDCSRPCEAICPAQAISFYTSTSAKDLSQESNQVTGDVASENLGVELSTETFSGVISDRCYGCGRCLPVCPIQHISTRSYVSTPAAVAPLILQTGIDAIEIHTQIGRLEDFQRLWKVIAPWTEQLKLVSISCPDGDGLIDYLRAIYAVISPLSCALIWQTDGRPMSGDIGAGATRAAVKLSQKVLAANLPGYIQLAGGTNHHTVLKLRSLGLLANPALGEIFADSTEPLSTRSKANQPSIAGVAYGSYARALLLPVLNQLEAMELNVPIKSWKADVSKLQQSTKTALMTTDPFQRNTTVQQTQPIYLEDSPELLWQAVNLAHTLVSQLKFSHE